jgi:hypothetical protein
MINRCLFLLYLFFFYALTYSQNYHVLESTSGHVILEFNFTGVFNVRDTLIDGKKFNYIKGQKLTIRNTGQPWLPNAIANIGIPDNAAPQVKILNSQQENYSNVFILPYPDSLGEPFNRLKFDKKAYGSNKNFPELPAVIAADFVVRYARVAELSVSPFQFNPVERKLIFNKKITVEVDFKPASASLPSISKTGDRLTERFLSSSVANPVEAGKFISIYQTPKKILSASGYWYNPVKDYYKIYVNKKGVYRVTYDQLISSGISPSSGIQQGKLELYNNGVKVPIDIVDADSNGVFNSGDYFQFVGYPPKASPYCALNIYNLENVYWLSYQSDSLYTYNNVSGLPLQFNNLQTSNYNTLHFEKDLDYERLGYAPDGNRDFWFWGQAIASGGVAANIFQYNFDVLDSNINSSLVDAEVRVKLQGITTTACSPSHNAFVNLNGQRIGTIQFDDENDTTFVKDFKFNYTSWSADSIRLLWSGNYFEVGVDGNNCSSDNSDIIRIDWFEFDYWRWNRVINTNYNFTSPPGKTGPQVFYLWQWLTDNMKIYIPSKGKMMLNPLIKNDADKSVYFTDTVSQSTEYFCVSNSDFILPDSIIKNINSDLRNISNGADYIIITHPNFMSAARQLADFRSSHLSGYSSPRIKIVNVNDIYNEFSYGLLDPYALQNFVKYAFNNWQKQAPAYIVLFGDMSYDYRHIYSDSRPDFIPSVPYQSTQFGQAASDNMIVAVSGDDVIPDLAIGRLSCETIDEANILVDKIVKYPADNSKAWKKNVLLMASGLDASDELQYGFNDQSISLDSIYLIPNGINSNKVFRYPNNPAYLQYQGGGPEIRNGFDEGAVLANYYGHGGGGQWDLVFTNDDIYQLNNGGRLPLILSVTCYTAHFDNQDIFGEIFNKIPGKGSIGFFGSSGLTWWDAGAYINTILFDQIFNQNNYVFGDAVLGAKTLVPPYGYNAGQIAMLTYLGDPGLELALPKYPDFAVSSPDISISPGSPVVGDTVNVIINVHNNGVDFPGRFASLQLYQSNGSVSSLINTVMLPSFGDHDSVIVKWIPTGAGLYQLTAKVNESDTLYETDHSDNTASASFSVYDFGEPNIVKPLDGYFTSQNKIEFEFADIGQYIGKIFQYIIEIDTSVKLNSASKITSTVLSPANGVLKWVSPALGSGVYFWRATIFDNKDSNKSAVKTFSISNTTGGGYLAQSRQLKLFETSNVYYSDSVNGLVLNTQFLPPRPSDNTLIDSTVVTLPQDLTGLTSLTTDGSYFYLGSLYYYNSNQSTPIYKFGTGLNGTVKGKNYGVVPNVKVYLKDQLFYYSDGNLYAATGDANSLLKINPVSGDTSRVTIPGGLLPSLDNLLKDGGFYVATDGKYVYNLSVGYSLYRNQYVVRTLNPANSWKQVGSDLVLAGSSDPGFSNFFIVNGYAYTYESYSDGYLRRYRLSDGVFEEQWMSATYFDNYYAWCYDWNNNYVYSSSFRPGSTAYIPGFHKFRGIYKNTSGSIATNEIGPAGVWNSIAYNFDLTNSKGTYKAILLARTLNNQNFDTVSVSFQSGGDISTLNKKKYNYAKIHFLLTDTSTGISRPVEFKSAQANYTSLPEIALFQSDLVISPDTIIQGLPVNLSIKVNNIGYAEADSVNIKFYLDNADSAFYTKQINIKPDSSVLVSTTLQTAGIASVNDLKVTAAMPSAEFFSFNNSASGEFYSAKDSIKPSLQIIFDGREIISGDIVSAKPIVMITLKDNSPLPLDTTDFAISYDGAPFIYSGTDVKYSYSPYPNSRATITWNPKLKDGQHTLDLLAKDVSGNYTDSTATHLNFQVYNQSDIIDVFNYPNPFRDNTDFTFQLTGSTIPDELRVKIYTVAGRQIREINIPVSDVKIGFNKFYWDGRDQDGDLIANGVYLYKIIYKNGNVVKSVIQKLAKVR